MENFERLRLDRQISRQLQNTEVNENHRTTDYRRDQVKRSLVDRPRASWSHELEEILSR